MLSIPFFFKVGFPRAQTVKDLLVIQDTWVQPPGWVDPLEKEWLPTPVFLLGESHGQRSLAGYSQSMGLQRVRQNREAKCLRF